MIKYICLSVLIGILAGCQPAEKSADDDNSSGSQNNTSTPKAQVEPKKKPSGVKLADLEKRDAKGNPVGLPEKGLWFKRGEQQPYTGLVEAFYNNGKMESQIHYERGVRAGVETHWYENGQKRWEMNYESGRMVSMKQWDVDGNEQKQ